MRVIISVDLEGIAGVVHHVETKLEGEEYERARRWMTGEANAAIEGAFAGGASEVVVNDSHGHMRNLLAEELHKDARLIRGNIKPFGMMQGIEPGTAAAFLIGYHAKAGTGGGILNHSFMGGTIARLRLNALEVGETGYNAALAGAMGIPVALVSGDEALSREVEALLPWAERVVVKKGITSWAAETISPLLARELIAASAKKALQRLQDMSTLKVSSPIRFEVEFFRPIYADLASMVPGVQRLSGTAVAYEAADMLAINQAWATMKTLASSQPGGYG
ncbi:MAG: M55 family metallopeptidase [Chloroflexi bacterium]|nr:M55 family metallopeptidase [Chloroflexota bacterium]